MAVCFISVIKPNGNFPSKKKRKRSVVTLFVLLVSREGLFIGEGPRNEMGVKVMDHSPERLLMYFAVAQLNEQRR
jgi:hypothetical protein